MQTFTKHLDAWASKLAILYSTRLENPRLGRRGSYYRYIPYHMLFHGQEASAFRLAVSAWHTFSHRHTDPSGIYYGALLLRCSAATVLCIGTRNALHNCTPEVAPSLETIAIILETPVRPSFMADTSNR